MNAANSELNMSGADRGAAAVVSREAARKVPAAANVLIVSYLFPPAGGVGVQRALSLAKYLPQYGFRVEVLRALNASCPVHDPDLLKQVPPSVGLHDAYTPELPFALRQKVWRWFTPKAGAPDNGGKQPSSAGMVGGRNWKQRILDVGRRILSPEPEVLWVPFALRQARAIVKRRRIDTVLITAPPFSAFLIGNRLKKEFPHIRLVSDFRDDWLRFYLGTFAFQQNGHVRLRATEIERETVTLSDKVVVVTPTMLDHMRERYPDVPPDKFACVPNGYDEAIFHGWNPRPHGTGKVVISHVGTVYAASSPRSYLDALDGMPAGIREGIETRFVGRITSEELPHLENRLSTVRKVGFVPHREALAEMGQADYLLVVMHDGPSLTGKIFEYLATGKPILAITPNEGEVARLLRETGCGWSAAPDDPEGIRAMLAAAYERASKAKGTCYQPNWEAIRRYERFRLAGEFGELLNRTGGSEQKVREDS
jgi:glycosyltransferase involved in cell wall biosynthesis